ncbi:MAG TPA: hypothetical protein VL549_02850 [Gemmatimonadales bacterium]|jgi:hypothetical protein|nr:hypothetical protein [Gemmatimonadales bacterium]
MLRRHFSILSLLILVAIGSSGAQATGRRDTLVVGQGALSGTWSANNGSSSFVGGWTAVPDTVHGSFIGTWTLANAQGAIVAYGGWSAAKSAGGWTGRWRANVTGRAEDYAGAWTSSIALDATARFGELFEAAARTIVRGTWTSGGRSGAWAIRAAK